MTSPRITLRAARTALVPIRYNARRFASTNQQAAAAGGSSGLVGGLTGGAIVFGVSSSSSIPERSSHLQARLQLLPLLRGKVHRQRRILNQNRIQQAHTKHPILGTRTKRGIKMAPINRDLLCCFYSRRKVLRRLRIQ
jgi:hypothetical protein